MGAKIRVAGPQNGLYLIIAHTTQLEQLVARIGGKIAMRFTPDKLLAALPFEGYMALKSDPRIARIGPVSLDPQRLKTLTEHLTGSVAPQPENS